MKSTKPPSKRLAGLCSLACAVFLSMISCSTPPPPPPASPQSAGLLTDPVLGVADPGTRCTIPAMMDLWRRRSNGAHEDYPLGPGDEIIISVPEVDELQNQHMRVMQDGTISLPLVGTVEVGGLDEEQAREAIQRRLAKYMKEPRLEMYVDRYRSRGVAVAGAVQKPGVYDLASFGDSLNDMLAMAGGLRPRPLSALSSFPPLPVRWATPPPVRLLVVRLLVMRLCREVPQVSLRSVCPLAITRQPP